MNVGGTARYVGELVEKIPDNKLATGYVQGSEIEDPCVQKLNVMRVRHMGRKISPLNDFRAWLELRKIVKEIKPAIVHTHTFKAGLIGRLIGGKHKRVHTFHGHLFDDQSFSSLEKHIITNAEKFLANRTDLLISVGKKVGVELRAQGIGTEKEWLSIAPGVKALSIIDKTQARKSLGLSTEGVLFGWMARMAEVKNPFLLLEIARQLPQVSFVMAGGGNLLEEIKIKAPKNITVIGWADAATFWSAVDCAISTSDNEGMPVALIEAQLAGVPVIATDVGSNAEVIKGGFTGIVTSKNSNELINAVKKLVADKALMHTMGKTGRDRATEEFSLKKMLDTHKQAYVSLMK
jgi:glycosyltransferase involved in cell wall biosynthesis